MQAVAKAGQEERGERAREAGDMTTGPASMARFLDAVRSGRAAGGQVAWTAGGRHLVGELVKLADDTAIVARTVSAAAYRPETKSVALGRLRPASADGPEADALAAHHEYAEQQQKWWDVHDRQFETYCLTSFPDASYTKDFTLTAEAVLCSGRAHVVPDGLVRGGDCHIYMERVENRFGKVVRLRGYQVSRHESWPFVTRTLLPGQLPRYGTLIEGQDGKSYVVSSRHTWDIRSQLSPGERVRLKETGEEKVIKGEAGRSQHGNIVYLLEEGGTVLSLDTERVDTEGDRIVTAEDPREHESSRVAATWVARVLPEVEALMTEYKARYLDEYKALTPRDHRDGRSTTTNPNIWTHLAGVATRLKVGDYDEAVEELGTMVGMGRGIGNWAGGDAANAIKNLIASIRAEVANKHARTPSEAEIAAGAVHIAKARYLRLEGMSSCEALRNERTGYGRQVRLDLVKADDPVIHPPIRSGQYTVFLRDGQLYARQWNALDGFHDRALSIVSGPTPFAASTPPSGIESMHMCTPDTDTLPTTLADADSIKDDERSANAGASLKAEEQVVPVVKRASAISRVLEAWKAIRAVHYLPFERWDAASSDAYAVHQLVEQKIFPNGVGSIVSVNAIRLNGRLYVSTGGCHHGLQSFFEAWALVPEASFRGETTTRWHDDAAIDAGKRKRGDHRGLIVMHRGQRYVFDRKIEVHATLPSPSQAVGVQEAIAHAEQDLTLGYSRSESGSKDIEWKQLAGFTVGVFDHRGQDPRWMLYYRDLRGYVRSFYLPDPDALPSVRASDVGIEEEPMAEGKEKRGTKDYGHTLCDEWVTGCIDETCKGLHVDWADREVLREALSRAEDPKTGKPITTAQHRNKLRTELEHLDSAITSATEYLAQFVEGADDVVEQKQGTFKRGDAVLYYGASGPQRMWWGAKMYAYRILATDPANLDVGLTIKEEEIGRTVFPAPNEHGVYVADDAAFTTIEYRKQRSYVRVAYLQSGPDLWVARFSYFYGTGGHSGPARISDTYPTWTEAVRSPLIHIIGTLARDAARDPSVATRRFAKNAMLGLLAQLPASLQTTIINELNARKARA